MKKLKVTVDGQVYEVEVEPIEAPVSSPTIGAPTVRPAAASAGGKEVPSPLAGKVVEVKVKEGDSVTEGDTLLVLEAMKMNTLVSAPESGAVASVMVAPGDMVEEGQSLLVIA